MPESVRIAVIALWLLFFPFAVYHRVQSQRTREKLDRTREGLPIMIGLRVAGFGLMGTVFAWLYRPAWFAAVAVDLPIEARWIGVCVVACALLWLGWMFRSLGRNLTDTVVTRRDATFVCHGPYRYVRNPMYTGVFVLGLGFGLALGSWLIPLLGALVFSLLAIRTRTEEKYLIDRFGRQYLDYMSRVGRFLPKLTHRRATTIRQ